MNDQANRGDRLAGIDEAASALPRTWADVMAFLSVCVLCLGGIAWGLKLEWNGSEVQKDLQQHLLDAAKFYDAINVHASRLSSLEAKHDALLLRVSTTEARLSDCERRR